MKQIIDVTWGELVFLLANQVSGLKPTRGRTFMHYREQLKRIKATVEALEERLKKIESENSRSENNPKQGRLV